MKRKNLMLGFAALLFSATLIAQPQGGKEKGLTPEEKAAKQTTKMTETLQLNEKQQSEVKDINLRFVTQADEIKDKYEKMMREELKLAKETRDAELKEVLSADQFKKLKQMQADKKGNGEQNKGQGKSQAKGPKK